MPPHIQECSVSLGWLLSFARGVPDGYNTAQVVHKIIVPATSGQRCRYTELEGLPSGAVGRGRYFISHRWAAEFVPELVALVCGRFADVADAEDAARGRGDGVPTGAGRPPSAAPDGGALSGAPTLHSISTPPQPPSRSASYSSTRCSPAAGCPQPSGALAPAPANTSQAGHHHLPTTTLSPHAGGLEASPLTRPRSLRASSRLRIRNVAEPNHEYSHPNPNGGAVGIACTGSFRDRTCCQGVSPGSLDGTRGPTDTTPSPPHVPLPGVTASEDAGDGDGASCITRNSSLNPLHAAPPCTTPLPPPWPQQPQRRQLSRGPSRTSRGSAVSNNGGGDGFAGATQDAIRNAARSTSFSATAPASAPASACASASASACASTSASASGAASSAAGSATLVPAAAPPRAHAGSTSTGDGCTTSPPDALRAAAAAAAAASVPAGAPPATRNAALVDRLLSRFAGRRRELLSGTYVWLDIFAINQHSGTQQHAFGIAQSFGNLPVFCIALPIAPPARLADDLSKLQEVVGASEATLLVLDARGMVLTRIWCLYEIWQTVRQRGPKGLRVLSGPLRNEELARVWRELDVERAEATVAADRDRILADIRATTGSDPLGGHIKRAVVESAVLELEAARAVAPRSLAHAERAAAAAALLRTAGSGSEALAAAAEAVEVAAEACGPHHPVTLQALRTLAGCHKDFGRAEVAVELLQQQVVPLLDVAYGTGHFEYDAVWDLGMLQYTLGQYEHSYATLLTVLRQQLRALHAAAPAATAQLGPLLEAEPPPAARSAAAAEGGDSGASGAPRAAEAPPPLSAEQLPSILAAMRSLMEMVQAEERTEAAADGGSVGGGNGGGGGGGGLRAAVGEWGERVGLTLQSLGLVQKERCRAARVAGGAALLREARELMEASVQLLEVFGVSDRGMAALDARANLAGLAMEGGDLQTAEALLRSTLALTESVYGREHPHTATAINNLAVCLKRQRSSPEGRSEAVALYRRCLALCGAALGEAHPETLVVATNLGVLLADTRQWSESEALLTRAVAGLPGQRGEGHPDVLTAYLRLAELLECRNRLFESEAMFSLALQSVQAAPPEARDHGALLEAREGLERVRGLLEAAARREKDGSGCCVVS